MLFTTGLFMVLFCIFLLLYHALKNKPVAKMLLVVAFSLYFYYKASGACVLILVGVTLSDYYLGLLLERTTGNIARRLIVAANVLVNVGMLVWFKYFNLLAGAFCSIMQTGFDPLDIFLPAGISFFTFRSISYMVDIYRGDMRPCTNLLEYAFFLTFFPPLLAGPVVRAKDLLPQIRANANPTRELTSAGLFMIMTGMVKKMIIADYISVNFVDRIFDNPALYSGFENMMGCIGFTVQLYCDFSGYSDMAIGLAMVLGYRFKDNFLAPFKSQSPSEFWTRWHISLSTWLRDYIYIPLGGNRKGRMRRDLNLFITMALGGLWHGATWMYVIWGCYNGLLLIGHKALKAIVTVPQNIAARTDVRIFNMMVTFALMVIGFTFFRAPDMATVQTIGTQIISNFHISVAPQFVEGYLLIVAAMALGYIAHMSPRAWTTGMSTTYVALPYYLQAAVLALVIFLVIQARQSELVPFIYLQY